MRATSKYQRKDSRHRAICLKSSIDCFDAVEIKKVCLCVCVCVEKKC